MQTQINLHPFNFIILQILGLAATFLCNSLHGYLLIITIMFINLVILVRSQLKVKVLFWFSLSLAPALIAMFISSYLFARHADLANLITVQDNTILMQSLTLTLRLFTLSLVSFAFMYHMPKEITIQNLMQYRLISVRIGFSLLAVFNAVDYLKSEFARIQIAYQMRYKKRYLSPKIILPLLIAAARYAHSLSISMHSRGLNPNRTYLTERMDFRLTDLLVCVVTLMSLILTLIAQYIIQK